jgi:actin-like ATPase involved in cell morphogenesis
MLQRNDQYVYKSIPALKKTNVYLQRFAVGIPSGITEVEMRAAESAHEKTHKDTDNFLSR